jgi:hypothetical protein
MRLHNPSLKQVEEYSWMQEFEGRRIPIKVRVYFTPFDFGVGTGKATGKYNTSVFIGGKCYPFDDRLRAFGARDQGACKLSDAYVERPRRYLAGRLNSWFADGIYPSV